MKLWQYTICVILSVACVGLSVGIIFVSQRNTTMQNDIQARQQQLNNSVLGPQAQQITTSIMQDMAAIAAKNDKMRGLLAKHGYNVATPTPESTPTPASIPNKPTEKSPEEN